MFQNLRLLFLRFFIAVREINYPSYFIDYYEIHLKKKKRVASRYTVDYASKPSCSRANSTSFCRGYFREQRDYARREKICTQGVGLDGIWFFSQITQNPARLARDTHIVLRTTQTRL